MSMLGKQGDTLSEGYDVHKDGCLLHGWRTLIAFPCFASCQQNMNLDQPCTSKSSEIVFASMLQFRRVITNQVTWCLHHCYKSKVESQSLSRVIQCIKIIMELEVLLAAHRNYRTYEPTIRYFHTIGTAQLVAAHRNYCTHEPTIRYFHTIVTAPTSAKQ